MDTEIDPGKGNNFYLVMMTLSLDLMYQTLTAPSLRGWLLFIMIGDLIGCLDLDSSGNLGQDLDQKFAILFQQEN